MDLAPSAVRKIILEEHVVLETKLDEMERSIARGNLSEFAPLFGEFVALFLKHIEREEQILRPVLKDIDAWGEVRVDRLNKEHAEQRACLKELEEFLTRANLNDWKERMQGFFKDLRADIVSEEQDFLNPDLLKDDPITVGGMSS